MFFKEQIHSWRQERWDFVPIWLLFACIKMHFCICQYSYGYECRLVHLRSLSLFLCFSFAKCVVCKYLSISLLCAWLILEFAVGYQNVILCHVVYTFLIKEWQFMNSCSVVCLLFTQWPYYFKLFSVGNFFSWLISKSFFFLSSSYLNI